MIKAVLLDLDDTLIANPNQTFVPAYLESAEIFFQKQYQIRNMSKALIASLKAMQQNHNWNRSNTETAIESIADTTNQPYDMLVDAFKRFYAEAYPTLSSIVRPHANAVGLIHTLKGLGVEVAIATNPVYPETAVSQRLDWGNIPPISEFSFVTHGDNMHFMKPNPAYYAETIARIGIEPDEAVMIGNDETNDIIPAKTLGMRTYRISADKNADTVADGIGTIDDLCNQVSRGWLDTLTTTPLHPKMILPELKGNVGALFGLVNHVLPHQWEMQPVPNEWSILQVVAHLLESEIQIQRPRLQRILNEDNPFLVDPKAPNNPPNEGGAFKGKELAEGFAKERVNTLEWLTNLDQAAWKRPARHSVFSNTDFLEMAHFMAQHDRLHITQICQTLGRCD